MFAQPLFYSLDLLFANPLVHKILVGNHSDGGKASNHSERGADYVCDLLVDYCHLGKQANEDCNQRYDNADN